MANRTRAILKRRKTPKREAEPNILERLKRLSDNAPVAELRGRGFAFDDDYKDIRFKER